MNVLVGTSGSDAPPQAFGNRSRHCYAASIGNDIRGGDPALKNAHAGTPVSVSIRIRGQAQIVRHVKLKSRREARTAFAALGCGRK